MADLQTTLLPDPPPREVPVNLPAGTRLRKQRGELWAETTVVLCLAVLPDLLHALMAVCWPQLRRPYPFAAASLYTAIRAVQVSVPVLYLLRRRGEPWREFGFVRPRWFLDLSVGFGTWLACWVLWWVFWQALLAISPVVYSALATSGTYEFAAPHPTVVEYYLLLGASCANAFAEELVMRGYLIPRFERLLGSTWKSLLLTTALFAGYHIYQGPPGILHAAMLGLIYGGVFCWLRRLWPVAIAHGIADVVGLIW